ncbi:hypothetical protein [Streptomyces sp. NBC_01353]|uniref:hypothetical protein n=1 Tax=Streptomyces sp. NBC_01353 TaxID=2903835 RepID=UPI002E34CDDE|nr:hypothetical protein [Streptomyces sp. NBC_01353]
MSRTSTRPAGLRRPIVELLGRGLPGEDKVVPGEHDEGLAVALVRSTRPARTLARHLVGTLPPASDAAVLLRELTERHLAGSPARWRRLHDALATSPRTLPELLADLPEQAEGADRLPPKSVCDTLALLLEQAAPEGAADALVALPDRTVETMLAGGSLPGPSLTSAVALHGDSRTRTALARHPRIDARALKQLLAAEDPMVSAAVYRNNRCTPSLRRAVVDAHAQGRVLLEDTLREELLSSAGAASRSRTAPLLGSGDPPLAAQALAWGVRKVAQRHALLRVLECRGADAVRAMLADPAVVAHVHPEIRAEVAAALDAPDSAARLRAAGEPYEDPATLPRLLGVSRGTSTLRDLLNEPYTHDFRALASANRTTPFMPKAAEELIRHEDATDAERAELQLTLLNEPWRAGGRIAGNLTGPSRRLAEEELDDTASDWAVGMVAAGLLDPVELVTLARPAARALAALHAVAERGLEVGAACDRLAALYREHLATGPLAEEALLRNLSTHPGPVNEAIRDAGAADDEASRNDRPAPSSADAREDAASDTAPAVRAAPVAGAGVEEWSGQGSVGERGAAAPDSDASPAVRAAPVASAGVEEWSGQGSVGERGAAAPDSDASPAVRAAPVASAGVDEGPAPAPVGERERAALGAIDLLRSLAAPGAAPLPDDLAVLRRLSAHDVDDVPGRRHPDWLREACLRRGLNDLAHRCDAPARADVLARIEETSELGSLARIAERAYLHGIVHADDLLHHLPAAHLLLVPHDWKDLAFITAWRRSLAAFLERELGTDADAWLRLAAAARRSMAAADDEGPGRRPAVTWPELLARSRLDTAPTEADPLEEARTAIGLTSRLSTTEPPTSPEMAVNLLARGNHLWVWPLGTLLREARPDALASVMSRLGADGPWMLAAFLLRSTPTDRTPLAYLLHHRDRGALNVLSEQSRWLDDTALHRRLDLADPEVDLAVLRSHGDLAVCRRIAARPGTLTTRLAADLHADPLAELPGSRTAWLESAEPELIELVFARAGKHLTLAQQLVGSLNLLRHGGRRRLTALTESGRLGATATRLCQKALATDDPAAPLAARAGKELAPARLAKRLRRARAHWQTREILDTIPGPLSWDALEAEHAEDPIPAWEHIARHPTAPHAFRLRNAAHLHGLSVDRPLGPELTVARARHGVEGHYRSPVDALLDSLLTTGQLTGRDLVHLAAPAAVVLSYLNRARRRSDAPEDVHVALTEVTLLVAERLGHDTDAWQRVHARLTAPTTDRSPAFALPALLSPN